MISIQHVNKSFNRGMVNEVRALAEINLEIARGEFVVIVGANGSGKSTLLNILSGSVLPSSGMISLDGTDITYTPEHKRSKWIARVFQDPQGGTAPDLSILDNFRLAAIRTVRKSLRVGIDNAFIKKVSEAVAGLDMGLEDKLHQPMGTLSGGQRQSLTLLMSVMDHTDVLLLDEPTAALDPRTAQKVMETAENIIREHNLTTLFISHNMQEALDHGDRIVQIAGGRIVKDLKGREKEALQLKELYGWFG